MYNSMTMWKRNFFFKYLMLKQLILQLYNLKVDFDFFYCNSFKSSQNGYHFGNIILIINYKCQHHDGLLYL